MTQVLASHSNETLAPRFADAAAGIHVSHAVSHDDALFPLQAVSTTSRFGRNQTIFNEGDDARYSYKVAAGRRTPVQGARGRAPPDRRIPAAGRHVRLRSRRGTFADGRSAGRCRRHALPAQSGRTAQRRIGGRAPQADVAAPPRTFRRPGASGDAGPPDGQGARRSPSCCFWPTATAPTTAIALDLPMGRQDIADYLGLTIETVCRALTELKREGMIAIPNRHQVVIRRMEGLEAVADGEAD